MPIVQPDADTHILWWLDEASQLNGLVDSVGDAGPLTIPSPYSKNLRYVSGPNSIGVGRLCTVGTGAYAYETGVPGSFASIFSQPSGQVIFSCFVRQDVAATGDMFCYGNATESEADSRMTWFISNTGYLGINFEHDNGIDTTITQSAGTGVTLGVWTHVAIHLINPPLYIPPGPPILDGSVTFFINGVSQQTQTFLTDVRHTGSSNGIFGLFTNFQTYVPLQGALKDMKISTSSADIASDAATINTTAEQVINGSTVVLYRMQTELDAVDQMGNVHLAVLDNLNALITRPLTADPAPSARSRTFNGGTGGVLVTAVGPTTQNMELATVLRGECSIDFWLRSFPENSVADSNIERGFFLLNGSADESTAANFFAIALVFNTTANGYSIRYNWETGAGADHLYTTPINTISYITMQSGRGVHIGVVKQVSGSDCTFETWINGVLFDTSTSAPNYDGTMNCATALFSLGVAYSTGFKGQLDEVRISTVARTGSEFISIYNQGGGDISLPPPGARYGTGGEI